MSEKTKEVAIIGGGPVGLLLAKELEKHHFSYVLFEASGLFGGQMTKTYPEKPVNDVPGYPPMTAKELIDTILSEIDSNNLFLDSFVETIERQGDEFILRLKNGKEEKFFFVVIVTGLGSYRPRPLGLEGEDAATNILYAVHDLAPLKNKRVVVFGGGDSALDWAKRLSTLASETHLVHRRREFRGNVTTIENADVTIHVPYVPYQLIIKKKKVEAVTIRNVEDSSLIKLPCDYLLVNYGQIPSPSTFNLPQTPKGFGLLVDENQEIDKNIFAVGDVAFMSNRAKRVAPALEEIKNLIKVLEERRSR